MKTIAIVLLLGCGPARPAGDDDGEEGGGDGEGDGAGGEEDPGPPEELRMRPSEMLERLRNAGLDPANLPPLGEMTMEQKQNALMPAFARSLGVQCRFCHEPGNFAAPTVHRHVAEHMYDHFVRKLRMQDGSPVFCDSCHAGEADFLVEDRQAVMRFMRTNFVRPLTRIDGADHGCDTCHGDPPDWDFLPTTPE